MSGGSIVTGGVRGHAIAAQQYAGSSNLAIRMSGGSIVTEGERAYGIYGLAQSGNSVVNSGELAIDVSNSKIRAEGDFAIGVAGLREGTGLMRVTVSNSFVTTTSSTPDENGRTAVPIRLRYTSPTLDSDLDSVLTLRENVIESAGDYAIELTGGDDLLMIERGRSMIRGKVDFGPQGRYTVDGMDRLLSGEKIDIDRLAFYTGKDEYIELNPARMGEDLVLEDLELIDKTGPGWARIGTLQAHGALMSLSGGDLRLGGHLDLGERGTLRIHDPSRLIFEAQGYRKANHGRITAQQVRFLPGLGERKLYLADRTTHLFEGADLLVNESGAIVNGAMLYSESGQHLGRVDRDGQVHLIGTPQPDPGTVPSPPGDCPPGVEWCAWPVDPNPGARPVDPGNGDTGAQLA